jgi:uncharacterized damage-inducible protein DinB
MEPMHKPIALLLFAAALPALAQTTIKDTLVKHWKVTGEFTLEVAAAMPADSYNFRPNPEEMTFGQVMAHIANADANACSIASGMTRPELSPKIAEWSKAQQKVDVDKDSVIAFQKETFAFCDKAIPATSEDRYNTVVGPANRNLTAFEWLWSYFTHTAHHRGQAEVYLRVKGIKPPAYRF